jgi:hypothetical protein
LNGLLEPHDPEVDSGSTVALCQYDEPGYLKSTSPSKNLAHHVAIPAQPVSRNLRSASMLA